MERKREEQNPIEGFIQRHMGNLIDMAASEELRLIEIRAFMAWLQEKTGYKPKPIRRNWTKFDRERWEFFRANSKILHGERAAKFEEKRKTVLDRVAKYETLQDVFREENKTHHGKAVVS